MSETMIGTLRKLTAELDEHHQVHYQLPIGEQLLPLNQLIGGTLSLTFQGKITCCHCGRTTKKSYSQGFCFPCMQKLAQCDMCILKPETCHYAQGTCREPEWGEQHCFVPHYVYLANTSGLKVGITRHTQLPTRWIDQGATQALAIYKVNTRLQSGLVETALAELVADKTNWRAMLKQPADELDLHDHAHRLRQQITTRISHIQDLYGSQAVQTLNEETVQIQYPVSQYLTKISALNFDKTANISGTLLGIKGQYLIFDTGVLNIRKFSSYLISAQWN